MSEDDTFRIVEMMLQGRGCGYVLVRLALEAQGRDEAELLRAMSGLTLGMGCGLTCGALTGACCVLGLHAGSLPDRVEDDPRLAFMLNDVVGWFTDEARRRYGGIDCAEIMRSDPALRQRRCPELIAGTWARVVETLEKYGFDPTQPPPAGEAG